MEHQIFYKIRKFKIPIIIRYFFMIILVILWIISIILPIPASMPFGIFLIILGLLFIIWVHHLKNLKKIRKGILFFSKNFHKKNIRNHKIKDIKKHIKQILKNKQK